VRSRRRIGVSEKAVANFCTVWVGKPLGGKSFAIDLFSPDLVLTETRVMSHIVLRKLKTRMEGQTAERRGSQHPYCRPGNRTKQGITGH